MNARLVIDEHCGFCPDDRVGDTVLEKCPKCHSKTIFKGHSGKASKFECPKCGHKFQKELASHKEAHESLLTEFGNVQACRQCRITFPHYSNKHGPITRCPDCGSTDLVQSSEFSSLPPHSREYNWSQTLYGPYPKSGEQLPKPIQKLSDNPYNLAPDIIAGLRRSAGLKETQLLERNWRFGLDIDLGSPEFEDVDPGEARRLVVERLRRKMNDVSKLEAYAKSQYEDIIDEFEMLNDEADEDEFNYVMQRLYDWADDNEIWVGTLTKGTGPKSEQGTIEL